MGILNVVKNKIKKRKNIGDENHNSVIQRHVEFLIQQNNELGSRLQTLYAKLTDCGDMDEILEANEEINEILAESERLTKRIMWFLLVI